MSLLQKGSKSEDDAVKRLIKQINGIDDEKDKVGRYVFAIFIFVFLIASTILAVVVLNPKPD